MMEAEIEEAHQRDLAQQRRDDEYRRASNAATLARMADLLDLLRAKGVARAKVPIGWPGHGWVQAEFDLAPVAPPMPAGDTAAALEAAAEVEKCACGHDRVSEHHNGLCIAGACDPALCNPGTKTEGA